MHDVERAVMVEIDQLVVRACREWLPELAGEAFDDPRAELVIGDGVGYLRDLAEEHGEPFDVILVDSTDPVGPAEGLISDEFFRLARALLTPNGMLAIQTGSPMLMAGELRAAAGRIADVFPSARTYLGPVPSYPGVVWSWTVGSNGPDPSTPVRRAPGGLRAYTPEVHRAAFALPPWLSAGLEGSRHAAPPANLGPLLG